MTKKFFDKIEFYITNVCNLNCEGCNRFNNYKFAGTQRWKDHESAYEKWAQYIDIDQIVILGGEPLLNPDILDWVYGINRIFKRNVQILTNGYQINRVRGLYDALRVNGNWMGVSWHNPSNVEEFDTEVRKFLKGKVLRVGRDHPANTFGADEMWMDQYGIKIPLWIQYDFYQSAITVNQQGRYTLHNSDPHEAHAVCGFARFKNYHFISGRLYKCGPVALFPEFDQQHNLDITDEDRVLINSYQPLAADEYETRGAEFLARLDQALDQCKFCPTSLEMKRIAAVSKKEARVLHKLTQV